jgi:thiol:disulfide interchange protein DsbD
MIRIFLILFSLLSLAGFSQTSLKPVIWDAIYVPTNASEGEIHFIATIEKKWHIYSQRPTDVGPIPTSFTVNASADFELVGKVEESEAHEEYVAAFEAKVFVFSEKAVFKQKIKLKNQKKFTIKTILEFMTCNDIQCLPPTILEFSVSVPESQTKK